MVWCTSRLMNDGPDSLVRCRTPNDFALRSTCGELLLPDCSIRAVCDGDTIDRYVRVCRVLASLPIYIRQGSTTMPLAMEFIHCAPLSQEQRHPSITSSVRSGSDLPSEPRM